MFKVLSFAFLAIVVLSNPARAQNCATYPNALANGTNADANQVMANFNHVRDCVNSGASSGTLDDTNRRNILLNSAMISKLSGSAIRTVNTLTDGFAGSDGINTGSSFNYSVDTSNKRVAPTTATAGSEQSVGTTADTTSGGFTNVGRDFQIDNNKTVTEVGFFNSSAIAVTIKIVKRNAAGNYDVVVSEAFSHPGGGFATKVLTTPFAIPATGEYYPSVFNSTVVSHKSTGTALRAWKAGDITGTGQSGFTEDANPPLPYKVVYQGATDNMTLVTRSETVGAAVANARVLLEVQPIDSITLNSDLTAEVTCNGGTNWALATLSNSGNGQSGRSVYETADTACTSGTSFAARLKTLNNKTIQIYKLALTVH